MWSDAVLNGAHALVGRQDAEYANPPEHRMLDTDVDDAALVPTQRPRIKIVGNGEKLTVALVIVITVLTLKPSGLFGHVTVKRV